jgi:hypothetical protein
VQNPLNVIALDDDDMFFYKEFIALCERIYSARNGLSEDTITAPLETKDYNPNSIYLEEFPYDVQEIYACIICQTEFKDQKKIGIPLYM